ncbi:hypothetical protein BH23ACT9_BH23ACT9_24820 [soil metagenome]
MRTSNPTLSDSAFQRLGNQGGLGTQPGSVGSQYGGGYGTALETPPPPAQQGGFGGPAAGPLARTDLFTVEGAIYKTLFLLGILIATGLAAALLLPVALYPPVMIGAIVAGLALVLTISFKPNLAPTLSPVYAAVQGVLLGVITLVFEQNYPGIASQALVGTVTVLGVMLVLYRTGVIKVTQRFRMVVVAATGAIFVTYLLSFVLGFFGVSFGFLHGSSWLSIGLSVVIIGVAALNLALDFDFIENAAARGLPSKAEWYAAFGLLVTLIWIYLEILRLLAKLQSRD